jgi:glutathione synthase/RimK-type ligase-like ATP-grasp enzyme
MSSAKATTDHDEIRKWTESRGGHPAVVAPTEGEQGGGVLRIDFDDPDDEEDVRLHRIKWQEFFEIFDRNNLAFLRGEGDSRFNKFVDRATADS